MNRFATLAAVVLGSALVVGCESNNYTPKAEATQLAAYAAKSNYPTMSSTGNSGLFFSVADDGSVTLNNGAKSELTEFEVWVNEKYVIHVPKLNSLSNVTFTADTLFDKDGHKFSDASSKAVTSVEVKTGSDFMKAMGPVKPQMQQQ